ncbi:MAG: hypothetical protein ROW48_05985 [Bellilinea sp.]
MAKPTTVVVGCLFSPAAASIPDRRAPLHPGKFARRRFTRTLTGKQNPHRGLPPG